MSSSDSEEGLPLFPQAHRAAKRPAPITHDEAREAINQLFHRALKHNEPRAWMKGLLTFIAGMRRYSIFNAKLIYAQRPGAMAVGTERYWARRGRRVRPGAMPIVILVPKGPYTLVYEYEDTEGQQATLSLFPLPAAGGISVRDWDRLKAAAERDGRSGESSFGLFRIIEEGLGHRRHGDVHGRRDINGRFVVRINRNREPAAKWTTLVHELAHVCCGHMGAHARGFWPDRRKLPGIHPRMEKDIREFEAEAVAWIVASRAGIATDSVEYLSSRVAPLDNERIDLEAVLQAANHIEQLSPSAAFRALRVADED